MSTLVCVNHRSGLLTIEAKPSHGKDVTLWISVGSETVALNLTLEQRALLREESIKADTMQRRIEAIDAGLAELQA